VPKTGYIDMENLKMKTLIQNNDGYMLYVSTKETSNSLYQVAFERHNPVQDVTTETFYFTKDELSKLCGALSV